ncbi:MAG: helix-turn-helix domain-containing protein [Acidobacteria bacterium]|nr:helix-turn-helix domain-containing protein [Acidobacteriota bacterium]
MDPVRNRKWISVSETAELFGLSVAGVRKMIARGEIPAVHLGRTVRVDERELSRRLDEQLKGAGSSR